jgi:hypothetical protein
LQTQIVSIVFRLSFFVSASVCLAGLSFPLDADTIVSTDLGGDFGYLELSSGAVAEIGWTQTGIVVSGVEIMAEIDSGGGTESGMAYLTTRIGPGTTMADEIASTSYSVTGRDFDPTDDTLFTGLTLEPGAYFLVLTGYGPGGWQVAHADEPPIVAAGVSASNIGGGALGLALYPPANSFVVSGFLEYSVTGMTAPTTVPEPSTPLLIACAMLVLFEVRRRGPVKTRILGDPLC